MGTAERTQIPISNIYYMLCYAWNILKQSGETHAGSEEFENIYDLFAKVIINGVNNLLKRGFHREYVECHEELSILRGKLDVGESIKRQSFQKRKLLCTYDEFDHNVPFNQILKTIINVLIKYPDMDKAIKNDLIKVKYHFSDIDEIRLAKRTFSNLKYNRNNIHYRILMNICELIFYELITNESGNNIRFLDFFRDEQMAKLYEKFVLNFYKKHLPSETFKVHSPKIPWNKDSEYQHIGLEFLPEMQTDIVVENLSLNKQLIIDTKFYPSALRKSHHSETKKLISGNLYQIYTYVNNSNFDGTISGMLLYPTVDKELDLQYFISGKIMKVKTIDLSAGWNEIHARLIGIANALGVETLAIGQVT